MKNWPLSLSSVAWLTPGLWAGRLGIVPDAPAQSTRIFELRTYTTHTGKLDDVVARFRNHTTALFEKHGMSNIGYWLPREQPDTLIYIIAHANREAASRSWDAFRKDPDWIATRATSEANGALVAKAVSVFMDPANFSALK